MVSPLINKSTSSSTHFDLSEADILRESKLLLGIEPCHFQIASSILQLRGQHSILISPTGSGKSLTFILPFIWLRNGISLLICPLQLLGEQHAGSSLLLKLGIKAINLTAATASDHVFKDIENGVYQLVVAAPEYIAEDSRFLRLWRSSAFTSQVKRLIFDEAHCISQWGDFRKSYKNLCFLRYIMPLAVILVLSATLPPLILTEIQSLLGLPRDIPTIQRSNDRHNISLVVRQMQHSLRSLHDLAFLFPTNFSSSSQPPPKFMIFMETKDLCQRATRFLWQRLPKDQKEKVVWVHADMSHDHNQKALAQLRAGTIYGIVCTDVAGMASLIFGIDIPDIKLVIQYQLPASLSVLWQRLGRAARNPNIKATGMVLVEAKHFASEKAKRQKAAEVRMVNQRKRKHQELLQEASLATSSRERSCSPALSDNDLGRDPSIQVLVGIVGGLAPRNRRQTTRTKTHTLERGLDQFINSHTSSHIDQRCRRQAINSYFGNPIEVAEDDICCARCLPKSPAPSHCCDVCNPKLVQDLFRLMDSPKKPQATPRRAKISTLPDPLPAEYLLLMSRLKSWREDAAEHEWGPFFPLGGIGIIGDSQLERVVSLAHMGMLSDMECLRQQLDWCYHHEYGAEMLKIVHEIYPMNIHEYGGSGVASSADSLGPILPHPSTPLPTDSTLPPSSEFIGNVSEPPAKKVTRVYKCRACGGTGHNVTAQFGS
ncbi:hypothetical protein CTheo_4425 [Ceratobasidium theobromae]|uniref:DNA 3'-5' helicase n=1 Tax=Ceratobasidium theobromae TaxID=1582974 RepID=A0A5N5QKA3_9AGAM|nr:hypothetical protein CTheo_4425 [Ceratobasidium theobromae]